MPESYISEEMNGATGRELDRVVAFPISASDIRKWAIAVYFPSEPPRLFWDEAYAASTPHGGIVAPEDFNPFGWMTAEPEGIQPTDGGYDPNITEKKLGLTDLGLKFQLLGGRELEYGVRMRPGDVITAVRQLGGYSERQGRLGLMLFTTVVTTWTNQHGAFVRRLSDSIIRY